MLIFLLIIVAMVVFLVLGWHKPTATDETPLEILRKRYAKGEITKEDFEQRKKDLGL